MSRVSNIQYVHFSVRLPNDLVKGLDELAATTRRNRNQVIELLLESAERRARQELKESKPRQLLP